MTSSSYLKILDACAVDITSFVYRLLVTALLKDLASSLHFLLARLEALRKFLLVVVCQLLRRRTESLRLYVNRADRFAWKMENEIVIFPLRSFVLLTIISS